MSFKCGRTRSVSFHDYCKGLEVAASRREHRQAVERETRWSTSDWEDTVDSRLNAEEKLCADSITVHMLTDVFTWRQVDVTLQKETSPSQ